MGLGAMLREGYCPTTKPRKPGHKTHAHNSTGALMDTHGGRRHDDGTCCSLAQTHSTEGSVKCWQPLTQNAPNPVGSAAQPFSADFVPQTFVCGLTAWSIVCARRIHARPTLRCNQAAAPVVHTTAVATQEMIAVAAGPTEPFMQANMPENTGKHHNNGTGVTTTNTQTERHMQPPCNYKQHIAAHHNANG